MKTHDSCLKEKGKKGCGLVLHQQGAVLNKNSKMLFCFPMIYSINDSQHGSNTLKAGYVSYMHLLKRSVC